MTQDQTDALLSEAANMMDELRRERDSARQEAADLREALRLAQITPRMLLDRINVGGRPDGDRLVVMAQNPHDNHNWSRSVSQFFTVGELRAALANGVS